MSELNRTKFGSLSLKDSVTLSKLKNLDNHKKMQYVKRIEEILINVPKVKIKSSEVKKFQNGSQVEGQKIENIGKCLVFHEDKFLGLGEIDKTYKIKPKKFYQIGEKIKMSLTKEEAQEVIKKYGKNDQDTGSTEVQVALLTRRIEDLQKHFKNHKKDNHSRTGLLQIVSDRKKVIRLSKRRKILLLTKSSSKI